MKDNAEKKAQRERGTGEFHPERQSAREGGVQEASEGDRNKCISPSGQAGFRGNISQVACLLGGIIEQLLESEEEKLREVEECVDWYKRESQKVSHRIEKLKQLQNLAKTELGDISISNEEE